MQPDDKKRFKELQLCFYHFYLTTGNMFQKKAFNQQAKQVSKEQKSTISKFVKCVREKLFHV